MDGFKDQQILRTRSLKETAIKEMDLVKKTEHLADGLAGRKSARATKKRPVVKVNKAGSEETKKLKKDAEKIPEIKKVKKAGPKQKPLTLKQRALLALEKQKKDTSDKISQFQTDFNAEITSAFKGYRGDAGIPDLTDYENLRDSDKDKRVKAAIKRQGYADQIRQYEEEYGDSPAIIRGEVTDKEELTGRIREFMEVSSKEHDIDTDEKFVANLGANYSLCMHAQTIQKMLFDAEEGGYLPEDIDMEAVQKRIAGLEELKFYLDNRKELMKSPYYRYMTSGDVAFNDKQIEHILSKTQNKEFAAYLRYVSELRKQGFKRKKGIKSLSKKIETKGKDQTEIFRTKREKRMIIEKLSDSAVNFRSSPAFQDRHFDARYSREVFMRKLHEFNDLDVKALHMSSLLDLAAHFDENARMFEQAREFENFLVMAMRYDRASIDDSYMIKLRAKIRVFSDAEKLALSLQEVMVTHPEEAVNDRTYADIEKRALDFVYRSKGSLKDDVPFIGLGKSLQKHYDEVYKTFKKEHADRKENIKRMYGMLNPVDDGDGNYSPGEISDEELEKRSKDYQKNALFSDHFIYGHQYMKCVWSARENSFRAVYKNRTGIDASEVLKPKRSMFGYTAGMSSEQYIKLVNLLDHGSEKEKLEFYRSMLKTAENADPTIHDLSRGEGVLGNLFYKFNMSSVLANFEDIGVFLKDPEEIAKTKAYFGLGCAYFTDPQNVAQKFIASGKYARAVTIEDMFKYHDSSETFISETEDYLDSNYKLKKDGFTYASDKEWDGIGQVLGGPKVAVDSRTPMSYKNLPNQTDFAASAEVIKYEEFVRQGLWQTTSKDDLEAVKAFYVKRAAEKEKPEIVVKAVNLAKEAPAADAGDEAIGRYCQDAESIFSRIMSLDPATFSFKSYKDIISDKQRFADCAQIISLSENAPAILERYSGFLNAGGNKAYVKKLKLNKAYIKEIEARCDLLKCVKPFFDGTFAGICNSPLIGEFGSLDEMLHKPDKIYRDRLKKAVAANNKQDEQAVRDIMSFIKSLKGFDINTPLDVLETRFRMMHGIRNDELSTPREVDNILKGTPSIFKSRKMGKITANAAGQELFEESLGSYFKEIEISPREREKLLKTKNTEQFIKNRNRESLIKQTDAVNNGIFGAKRNVSINLRVDAGEEVIESLAPFMKADDRAYNDELVKNYIGKKTRDKIIDDMTRQIMALNMDLDLTSDAHFAKNTSKLEYITHVVYAYKKILDANPGYMERLKNRQAGFQHNDQKRVTIRVNRLFVLSDYYRARKLLITNPYYVLHENSEMSMDRKTARNADQVRIAELYSLVNKCALRLQNEYFEDREHDDIGQVLSDLESRASMDAHLTGRVDLTAMDIEKQKKIHENIRRYLDEGEVEMGDYGTILQHISNPDEYPELKKYLTEDVIGYLKTVVFDAAMSGKIFEGSSEVLFTKRQKDLLEKLKTLLRRTVEEKDDKTGASKVSTKRIDSFALVNPANPKEVYNFNTNPNRLITDIVMLVGEEMAEDEMMDMMDGLLIGQRGELDLSDPKQWNYAKERWTNSVKKLYDLESRSVYKFEQTYGGLMTQIPLGCFMQTLGPDKRSFHRRTRFAGQNALELCDEQKIETGDGKVISVGEYLTQKRLIRKADNDRLKDITARYQSQNGYALNYYRNIFMNHGNHKDDREEGYGTTYSESFYWQYRDALAPLEGPGLSKAARRKLWKDAEVTKDYNILCGNKLIRASKDELSTYNSSQRKALKAQRAEDRRTAEFAAGYMDMRADDLYDETIKAIKGDNLPEETKSLIKDTLINFHPAMYQSGALETVNENGKTRKRESKVAGTDRFYENLKKFLGLGVEEDKKTEAKREAFNEFLEDADLYIDTPDSINTPEDIMSKGRVREDPTYVINGTNNLLKMEAKHRMFNAIQDLAGGYDVKTWMDRETHEDFRNTIRKGLKNEMIHALIRSDMYLNLKDIGNPMKTLREQRYEHLKYIGMVMSARSYYELDRDVLKDDGWETLSEFGIRVDSPIYEEEPAEVPVTQSEEEPVTQNKEQKISTETRPLENEETEELEINTTVNKEEKKEGTAKTGEKTKENLNVINQINEQQVPAVMAPVFEDMQYDAQGLTQYCWACTLAGLMNAYAGKQITSLSAITKQSNRINTPSFKQSGFKDSKSYNEAADFAKDMYSGVRTGNPSLVGDYVHKTLPNTAIRSVMIGVERGKTAESEAEFRRIANERIKKGPFGILHNGHYVLVRGIQGDRLLVNDSLKADPSDVAPYAYTIPQIFSVSATGANIKQIELVWLESMQGREQEIAKEFQFVYNDGTGEYRVDDSKKKDSQGKSKETILHRNGIEGSYVTASQRVAHQIYIPKMMHR